MKVIGAELIGTELIGAELIGVELVVGSCFRVDRVTLVDGVALAEIVEVSAWPDCVAAVSELARMLNIVTLLLGCRTAAATPLPE